MGFISDEGMDILSEYNRKNDYIGLDQNINELNDYLEKITASAVIGIIGKLGSGKTTFINQFIKTERVEDKYEIFKFDARKYPERKYLWENLILEITKQINNKMFKDILKEIEGDNHEDENALIETIGDIPGLSIIKNLKHFFRTTPATRVYQLQAILTKCLKTISDKQVLIVIEDVDRSGNEGIFFLETLNYYINEIFESDSIHIHVLALLGKESVAKEEYRSSFNKCLDFQREFQLIKPDFSLLLKRVLDENLQNRDAFINQINSFLQGIYSEYSSQANFRVIKKILRQANQSYSLKKATERGPFRWFIMLEASKLLYNKEGKTFADTRREEKGIKNNSNIFTAYICMLILSINRVTGVRHLDSIYDNKDGEYTLKSLSKYYGSNTEIRIEDSIDTITYSSNFGLYSNENYNEYLIIPLNYF